MTRAAHFVVIAISALIVSAPILIAFLSGATFGQRCTHYGFTDPINHAACVEHLAKGGSVRGLAR